MEKTQPSPPWNPVVPNAPPSKSAAEQQRIERVARSAVELHPCVWAEFIEHACGDDRLLERDVVRRLELRLK